MKNVFIFLLLASSTFASASNYTIKFQNLSTFSSDHEISEIIEVRAQVNSYSRGGFARRDCYKEYQTNFPFSAQTTSFQITKNLDIEVQGKTIQLGDLKEVFNTLKQELKNDLNWGCKTEAYLALLIKGKTLDSLDFKSNLLLDEKGGELINSTLDLVLKANSVNYLNLTPTVYDRDTWKMLWSLQDPAISAPQTNY